MQTQYGFMHEQKMKVFYTGTNTLKTGYCLCFDADTNNDMDNMAYSTAKTTAVENPTRLYNVEKPAGGNIYNFAGVVAPESNDVTGPAPVTIILPGSGCNVYAKASCTINVTRLCVMAGQYYMSGAGVCYPGTGSGMALQTVDRSTTAGLVQMILDTGPQCGGYGEITSAGAALATTNLATFNGCAVVNFLVATNTAANATATLADGTFAGQRKLIYTSGTQTTHDVAITVTKSGLIYGAALTESVIATEIIYLAAAGEAFEVSWTPAADLWLFLAMTGDKS